MANKATLVDSNVLLDLVTGDPATAYRSQEALTAARQDGPGAINPIVYAEVSIRYETADECDKVFPESHLQRLPLPWEAAFVAGKAFLAYRRAGGSRTAPLPDFFIGAHAAVAGLRLLTRDAAPYRTYLPSVELMMP